MNPSIKLCSAPVGSFVRTQAPFRQHGICETYQVVACGTEIWLIDKDGNGHKPDNMSRHCSIVDDWDQVLRKQEDLRCARLLFKSKPAAKPAAKVLKKICPEF